MKKESTKKLIKVLRKEVERGNIAVPSKKNLAAYATNYLGSPVSPKEIEDLIGLECLVDLWVLHMRSVGDRGFLINQLEGRYNKVTSSDQISKKPAYKEVRDARDKKALAVIGRLKRKYGAHTPEELGEKISVKMGVSVNFSEGSFFWRVWMALKNSDSIVPHYSYTKSSRPRTSWQGNRPSTNSSASAEAIICALKDGMIPLPHSKKLQDLRFAEVALGPQPLVENAYRKVLGMSPAKFRVIPPADVNDPVDVVVVVHPLTTSQEVSTDRLVKNLNSALSSLVKAGLLILSFPGKEYLDSALFRAETALLRAGIVPLQGQGIFLNAKFELIDSSTQARLRSYEDVLLVGVKVKNGSLQSFPFLRSTSSTSQPGKTSQQQVSQNQNISLLNFEVKISELCSLDIKRENEAFRKYKRFLYCFKRVKKEFLQGIAKRCRSLMG